MQKRKYVFIILFLSKDNMTFTQSALCCVKVNKDGYQKCSKKPYQNLKEGNIVVVDIS
jgi:hypothetical protein